MARVVGGDQVIWMDSEVYASERIAVWNSFKARDGK